jgi:hypothetical protein
MNWRDKIIKEYKEHDKNCICVFCEVKQNKNREIMKNKETIKKVERTIVSCLLRKNLKDISLRQLARILGISDRRCNNIYGLDYYYGDNTICAYSPNSNDMRYSYEDVKSFLKCHGLTTMEQIKEYTLTAWYNN